MSALTSRLDAFEEEVASILDNAKLEELNGMAKESVMRLIKRAMTSVLYEISIDDNGKMLASTEYFGYSMAKDELSKKKKEIAEKYGLTF